MRIHLLALAVAAAFVTLLPAAPAHAAGTRFTWVGSSQDPTADNHSWTDARNWSPQGVPGNGDSVSIAQPNGSHCTAHVDNVPTVTLTDLTLRQTPDLCGTSINGGQLTVTGTFTWDGGALASPTTLAAGSVGTINGTNDRQNGLAQDLDVAGSLSLTGVTGRAALLISNPSVLHVLPGGTLTSVGDNLVTFLSCCNNPARVTNDGTVAVDGGTFEVDAVAFDQDGTLTASGGGRLLSTAAPVTAGDGASYDGTGGWTIHDRSHAVVTGTQTLGPDFHLELGSLTDQSGSTLAGAAVLAGSGTFDWSGATIEADLTVAHGVTVHAAGVPTHNGRRVLQGSDTTVTPAVPAPFTIHGRLVVDQGAEIGTAGTARLVIASDGTLSLAPGSAFDSGACCVSPDRIVNHGTVEVTDGPGSDPVVVTNVFLDSDGDVAVPTGQVLELNQVVTVRGGTLLGTGTLAADVDNVGGTVRPAGSERGTFTVDGSYHQHRSASLAIDLGQGTGDRLVVTGTATLGGRLATHDLGGYRPRTGATRQVLAAASVTGRLGCAVTSGTASTGADAGHWQPRAGATLLKVRWVAGRRTQC